MMFRIVLSNSLPASMLKDAAEVKAVNDSSFSPS